MSAADLIEELRGFAQGSNSARASLMRDAANALARQSDVIEGVRGQIDNLERSGPAALPVFITRSRRIFDRLATPMDDRTRCDGCGRVLNGPVRNVGDSMEVVLHGPCCASEPPAPDDEVCPLYGDKPWLAHEPKDLSDA